MTEAKLTWSIWQALLKTFAWAFTCRGFHRFAEWITAMALNVEEHTITQSVLALEQPAAWKALESFAEYGSWHQDRVTWGLTRLIATAPGRIWHGYHVSAVDDTKVHRSSPHVWGTCTFHEYTARCPNRATTVRAHNWVVFGALLPEPEKPAWFLPISGRLYFRKSQLPVGPEGILEFHTKCELAVALLREQARIIKGKHLAVFDGGYALESVVRPLVLPAGGAPRIEFLTRLRCNARLYALPLPPEQYPEGKPGPKPKWGKRLEPPRRGGMWNAKWQVGTAFVYGRQREIRWKEIICLWRVLGWEVPVKAIVASVEGYKQRFTLVTSAVELTGLQMVEEVRSAVPAAGRVPRPEAAAGLGGVPSVDGQPDPADQPGAAGDDEPAAAVAVPAGGVRGSGLVVPAAVEQEEGSSQRAGRAAADAAASGANSAISLEAGGK